MRVTAKDIAGWAERREAQGELPRLIRRLAMQAGSIMAIAFPAGDSVSRPGWDGQLTSKEGDAWVPAGRSLWELSVRGDVTTKANEDYIKRTDSTSEETRIAATLVIVTARHWAKKDEWSNHKRAEGLWRNVVAYDADDLEAWLEVNPAIALAFAEDIGIAGDGVETVTHHWWRWASQCQPPISPQAFFADRQNAKSKLLADLREHIGQEKSGAYAIRADSTEEAAAFVCATVLEAEDIADAAVVLTDTHGWRFVEVNPRLRLVIAIRPEIAARPATDVLTVVPAAAGDLASGYGGIDGSGFQLQLKRPSIYAFRDALIEIGVEESDARRLARSTGRSWSVFRRRRAANPAIRRPYWLALPESDVLASLCLLGAWYAEKPADRNIVQRLVGDSYEAIERKLRLLAQVDDAPVVSIGKVWYAKAPLELLDLYANRITGAELDRFFEIVESILIQPDPMLELESDKRWMAQVYGKVRDESGLLFESVCDALVRLAVRGADYPGLETLHVEARVKRLIEGLLQDADETRWLSLASHLRPLAEAAPDTFLRALETSLARSDAPIMRLFTESVSDENPLSTGIWWYSDLLWALETLAWSPRWMPRVALALARLSHVKLPDNWGNRPIRSLVSLFRSWWPQTAATLDQRIAVLDRLIASEPDIAFALMDSLLHHGSDIASPSSKPNWRDDDAGTVERPTGAEVHSMLNAAADRMIEMANGNAIRIVHLLDKLTLLGDARIEKMASMVSAFVDPSADDADRELIRDKLREQLHWHLNYGNRHPETDLGLVQINQWCTLYDALSPSDSVIRHRWLFRNGWVYLPIEMGEDFEVEEQQRVAWRLSALREIYRDLGFPGIERLAETSSDVFIVGRYLLEILDHDLLASWTLELAQNLDSGKFQAAIIAGIVRFHTDIERSAFLRYVIQSGRKRDWPPEHLAAFLRLARDEPSTWSLVEECGGAVESAYWRTVNPWLLQSNRAEREHAVSKLLEAGRPISALNAIHDTDDVNPALLADALDAALGYREPDAQFPDSWHLAKLIERLESWADMDQTRLLQIEFQLVPAFRIEQTSALKVLTEAITSRPELFAELICLLYRPECAQSETQASTTEGERTAAENAWHLLHECRRQPGTLPNGEIDHDACIRFVDDALGLCREQDRLTMAEQTIGKILAHAPEGADGIWPGSPVRDILDRPEFEQMRAGFEIGARNKRGVTTRAMDAGGEQERELAARFRGYADALAATHPFLAESLQRLAQSYGIDARREDDRAALWRERY